MSSSGERVTQRNWLLGDRGMIKENVVIEHKPRLSVTLKWWMEEKGI